jgi:hypothetical protein
MMNAARAASHAAVVGMSMIIGYKLIEPGPWQHPDQDNAARKTSGPPRIASSQSRESQSWDNAVRKTSGPPRIATSQSRESQSWEITLPFEPIRNKVKLNQYQMWQYSQITVARTNQTK